MDLAARIAYLAKPSRTLTEEESNDVVRIACVIEVAFLVGGFDTQNLTRTNDMMLVCCWGLSFSQQNTKLPQRKYSQPEI